MSTEAMPPTVLHTSSSFDKWTVDDDKYKGLLLKRNWKTDGNRFQHLVEVLAGKEDSRGYRIFDHEVHAHLGPEQRSPEDLELFLRSNARELVEPVRQLVVPPAMAPLRAELVTMIEDDAVAIGTGLATRLKPEEIILKLETIGINRCSRWHRDWYIGRAICTYNGVATEFQEDSNVDFDKMGSSDKDDNANCVIDPKKTGQCLAGDVLYMRGSRDKCGGLVHRSPLPVYWPGGRVALNRLCLKVDIPKGGSCSAAATTAA